MIDTCHLRSYNPFMNRRLVPLVVVLLGWMLLVPGCAANASDKPPSVESQLASGTPIYTQTCATSTCHGTQGAGIPSASGFKAWPLVGDEFQTRHPNAQIVFDVIRSGDEPNLRALTDQQIYDAIAYQLNQNQIMLDSPLTSGNSFTTFGGKMSGKAQGGLFPPLDNATLIDLPLMRHLPLVAENSGFRLQIDQIAEASAIGTTKPAENGVFLIVVFVFTDLDQAPLTLNPNALGLSTPDGKLLAPQPVNIHSAIERLHEQTIKPQHGTAALIVFALPSPDGFDQLIYDDGTGGRLAVELRP